MKKKIALVAMAAAAVCAQAADWSDTSLSFTHGTKYAEPFEGNSISKNIYSFKNVSGDKYGQNFFNADLLESSSSSLDKATGSAAGAQEVYAVYRRLFDLQKITGKNYAFGPVKNVGLTAGFDWNTKNNSYASRKRMLVAGPTFMVNVKDGFFNVSLLMLDESNAPNTHARYHYKNHAALDFAWGVPTGVNNLSFEGWASYIDSKGKAEDTTTDTKPETHIYATLMYDISAPVGAAKNTFKLGAGYEYWKNKFGNDHTGAPGSGAFAKTPFVKAEYHF